MEKIKYILLVLALIYYPANLFADILHQESFESAPVTSNWAAADMFVNGGPPATDFFVRTNGAFTGYSPHPGNTNGEYYIVYRDTDALGLAACTVTVAAVAIDSAMYNNPQVRVAFSTSGTDYENSDLHEVYVSLDGGAYGLIGRVCGTSPNDDAMWMDSNLDGTGDTTPTTTVNFVDFTFPITGSFTQVQVRVVSDINFDSELAAMDNIRILGDPISLGGRGDIVFGVGYPGYAVKNLGLRDVHDISANKIQAYMRGSTTWVNGEYFQFVSSGTSYVRSPDNDLFSFTDNTNDSPFSVTCWAYLQQTSSVVFVGKYDTNQEEWWYGVNSAGQMAIFLDDASENCSEYLWTSNYVDELSLQFSWHHYGMTYDGSGSYSGLFFYVDGDEMPALKAHSGANPYIAMDNGTAPLDIGSIADLGIFDDLRIRQVKIWDRKLTADEMHNDAVNTRDGNL